MKTRQRTGFTLVELMFVVAFLFLVTGFVFDALVETTRVQNITGAQYDMQRESHHEIDTMIDDIHDSQLVLTDYVYGGYDYISDNSSTIVMQAPAYDSSGDPLGTNDIMIYYLLGTSAPYKLYRIVIPSTGSARPKINNELVVSNVNSMSLVYYVDDDIVGDGITETFTTSGVPTVTPSVMWNGTLYGPTSPKFSFVAPQTVTFANAPGAPDALDIFYTVSPAVSPSQVTAVNIDLKLQVTSSAFQDAAKTQTVEIASRTNLRNH